MRGARYVRWTTQSPSSVILELAERYYRATKVTCTDATEWRGHVEKMMRRLSRHPLMTAPMVWKCVDTNLRNLVSDGAMMIDGTCHYISDDACGPIKAMHKVMRKLEPFEAQEAT